MAVLEHGKINLILAKNGRKQKMKKRTIICIGMVLTLLMGIIGCSPKQEATMDIHAVWDTMEQEIEMPSMGEIDAETLSSLYPELPMDQVAEYEVHMAMVNIRAAEVALFEATDADAAAAIKTSVAGRKDALEQQWSMYLPDQYDLVKNAILEVNGKYVIFIVGEFADQAKGIVDQALQG